MIALSGHPDCVYNTASTVWFFLPSSCLLLVGGHLLHVSSVFCSMPQLPPSAFAPAGQRYLCIFDLRQFITTGSSYLSDFPRFRYCHCGSGSTNLLLGHQLLRKLLDFSKASPSQSFSRMSPLMGSTSSAVVFLKDQGPISNIRWHLPPHGFTPGDLSAMETKLTNRQ